MNPQQPSSSSVYSSDNLRLVTALATVGFPFEAHRAAPGSSGKAGTAYFTLPLSQELLDAVAKYYHGELLLDPNTYEQARGRVFGRVNAVLGRSSR